jgi:Ran GTPase-activating protein (RanGAP) involved in mRNA processing and transport
MFPPPWNRQSFQDGIHGNGGGGILTQRPHTAHAGRIRTSPVKTSARKKFGQGTSFNNVSGSMTVATATTNISMLSTSTGTLGSFLLERDEPAVGLATSSSMSMMTLQRPSTAPANSVGARSVGARSTPSAKRAPRDVNELRRTMVHCGMKSPPSPSRGGGRPKSQRGTLSLTSMDFDLSSVETRNRIHRTWTKKPRGSDSITSPHHGRGLSMGSFQSDASVASQNTMANQQAEELVNSITLPQHRRSRSMWGLDEPSSAYARRLDNRKWMQEDRARRAAKETERTRLAEEEAERAKRLLVEEEERRRREEELERSIKSDASRAPEDGGDEIFADERDWGRYFTRYGARERFFEIYSSVSKNAQISRTEGDLTVLLVEDAKKREGGGGGGEKEPLDEDLELFSASSHLLGDGEEGAAARPASPSVLSAVAAEPLAVEESVPETPIPDLFALLEAAPDVVAPDAAPEAAAADDDDDEAAEEDVGLPSPLSPRTNFVRILQSQASIPWPAILRKMEAPREISLQGLGLGDVVGRGLAEVLPSLPCINALNVRNNRLTDDSLVAICEAVVHVKTLQRLDISENDVDDAAETIRDYLASPNCRLKSLAMRQADVDDMECATFMEALCKNKSLTELDLSHNLIGTEEARNVVNPDFETGGEAIAEMMARNRTLTKLNISWNYIRKDSASQIGQSLEHNNTLKWLDMSYNSFGEDPGQHLGLSLGYNEGLTHLDIGFNDIQPRAAMVIANAFKTNEHIQKLVLDGNRLGKAGGEALMAAVTRCQTDDRFVSLSVKNCDLDYQDPVMRAFDPIEPTMKNTTLDCTKPYDTMVAAELIRLANTRFGCDFKRVLYRDVGEKKAITVNLRRENTKVVESNWKQKAMNITKVLKDMSSPFADGWMHRQISSLMESTGVTVAENMLDHIVSHMQHKWEAGSWSTALDANGQPVEITEEILMDSIFHGIYTMVDADASGNIDASEVQQCLALLGLDHRKENAERIISAYDVDKSGHIESDEFVSWLMGEYLTQPAVLQGSLIDERTGYPFEVPKKGFLTVDFIAEPMPPSADLVGTDVGIDGLIKNIRSAETDAARKLMLDKALEHSDVYMTFKQAKEIYDQCKKGMDSFELIMKIVPMIREHQQRAQLIDSVLKLEQKLRLRVKLGASFGPLLGNATGYYSLDLENADDRLVARRVAEFGNSERRESKTRSGRGDTSQKGNWENFRNEQHGETFVELNGKWLADIPRKGTLTFDYISTTLQTKGTKPLSHNRFRQLKEVLHLEHLNGSRLIYKQALVAMYRKDRDPQSQRHKIFFSNEMYDSKGEPVDMQAWADRKINGPPAEGEGNDEASVGDVSRVTEASMGGKNDGDEDEAVLVASESAEERLEEDDASHHSHDSFYSSIPDESLFSLDGSSVLPGFEVPPFILPTDIVKFWQLIRRSTHDNIDWLGPDKHYDMSKFTGIEKKDDGTVVEEDDVSATDAMPISCFHICYVKLLELQVTTCALHLSAAQAAYLISKFPSEDYLRVQALLLLFNRIVDVENINEKIVEGIPFSVMEKREINHRIGNLNLFNPMFPDHEYWLDLRYREQREVAKILIKLAVEEPGQNWVNESFCRTKTADPTPGWELPKHWAEEDDGHLGGPWRSGILYTQYSSDPDTGCAPIWNLRKELKSRCLCGTERVF